jgi:hypothetical protein
MAAGYHSLQFNNNVDPGHQPTRDAKYTRDAKDERQRPKVVFAYVVVVLLVFVSL